MGYSINYYLDGAISDKEINRFSSEGAFALKAAEKQISTKELQIFLYLRYPGKTIKVYTERKVTQRQWDAGKQRVNPNYFKGGSAEFNKYLGDLYNETQRIHEVNLQAGILTIKEHIRELVDRLNLKEVGPKAVSLEDAYKEFLRVAEHHKSGNTRKNYVTVWRHLLNYCRVKRKPLDFNLFTAGFHNIYSEFLSREANLGYNTIVKHFRILKTFLTFSTDEKDYNKGLEYKKWKTPSEKEKEIYTLNKEELMKLFSWQTENTRLAQVRDVFCFACFTGLRFSDVANLRWESIKNGHINVLPIKTRNKTTKATLIPLNPFSKAILEKYKEQESPLPVISSQKTNDYLKEIGQLIGLDEPVKFLKHIGNSTKEEYVPKWQVLTFHVARKTFITTSLILGIPERVVREFSGHKSEKDFAKYVKLADTYKEQHMHQAWNENSFK